MKLYKTPRQIAGFLSAALTLAFTLTSCDKNTEPEHPEEPQTIEVEMDTFQDGLYFGDFWKEGYADYYFIVSKGEIGQTSQDGVMPDLAPMNPGDYVLYLDLWGAVSADHTNPVVPEGIYTAHSGRANGAFDTGLTFATANKEKVGDKYRIQNILFADGTVTVKHTADGYDIKVDITSTEGEKYIFTYKGKVTLSDKSGEGEELEDNHIKANVNFTGKRTTVQKYSETDSYDNYVIRCFDTDKITNDGLYPNEPGHKIQLDIYTAHGADIAGTYTVSDRRNYTPGTFYPGVWLGTQALGTFCMQTDESFKVKFCIIKDGKAVITKNSDGTYTINCDFTDADGYSVKSSWTGSLEEYKNVTAPQTTLTSDITVSPAQCAAAYYYGDYYGTGTVNYGIVLTTAAEVLSIDFSAASGSAAAIPEGTYTVSSSNAAWTVYPGTIGYTSADPTCYISYDEYGYPAAKAPVAGGTMKISRNGSAYTVEFEFLDDYNLVDSSLTPHKISGKWTGTIPDITDYTKQ